MSSCQLSNRVQMTTRASVGGTTSSPLFMYVRGSLALSILPPLPSWCSGGGGRGPLGRGLSRGPRSNENGVLERDVCSTSLAEVSRDVRERLHGSMGRKQEVGCQTSLVPRVPMPYPTGISCKM